MSQEQRKEYLGQLMDNLKNYVGQEVIAIYWQAGKLNGFKGVLQDVVPFDFIDLAGNIINFVGVKSAIQMIALDEKSMVYYNRDVEAYQGFSIKDIMGLILAQEEMLGYSVKRAEIENSSERGK